MRSTLFHISSFLPIILFVMIGNTVVGQELVAPLSSMPSNNASKSNDTLVLELPFFDDFADYEGMPSSKLWLPSQAFVNKDYAPEAPTVGMATLDALDANGNLYPHASTNLFAADTLTSQIIRLDSLTGTYQRRLQPSDSVSISFFYIPGGWYGNPWELVGDAPSTEDSLFLEFYDANEEQWIKVWGVAGTDADTAGIRSHWPWKFAYVKIDDQRYFNKKFQFRFHNYASLDPNPKTGIAGNCDQWNIDYVYINTNRTAADSCFRDIAFVEKAPSMLQRYTAMPAKQFASTDMAQNVEMKIVNRYNQTLASTYSYTIHSSDGQQLSSYDGGYENILAFFPKGTYQTSSLHCNPPVNFTFPVNGESTSFTITHVVREGVGGDNRSGNDTVRYTQVFDNYYAYDDGVPENGYGLTAPGSKVWLACLYSMRVSDTLTAMDLYFNRTRNNENGGIQFSICVWSCQNGLPSTLIYKDAVKMTPSFDGMNQYHRYPLSTPVVVDDSVFIGFEQYSNDFINLGFDRSTDARRYTYYRTSGDWMQSILKGSVMMRPVFGANAVVGLNGPTPSVLKAVAYPNPATNRVNILCDEADKSLLRVTLTDLKGVSLIDTHYSESLDLGTIPNGIYILRINNTATGQQSIQKLIIKR